jgi:uncharacterized protein YbjQ (UPF0145 family)
MTGTASHHAALSPGAVPEERVVTSELSGEELWNLAQMGLVPHQLVMATSVYSLGVAAGIGAMFQSLQRGELPEVTKLIYQARENCLELVRREAQQIGAERVIGNRLQIREIGSGLVEVVAIGTAVRRADGMRPETPQLIPQAVIYDRSSASAGASIESLSPLTSPMPIAQGQMARAGGSMLGVIIALVMTGGVCLFGILMSLLQALMR